LFSFFHLHIKGECRYSVTAGLVEMWETWNVFHISTQLYPAFPEHCNEKVQITAINIIN